MPYYLTHYLTQSNLYNIQIAFDVDFMWTIFEPELGYFAGNYAAERFTPTAFYGSSNPKEAERELARSREKFNSFLRELVCP